MIFYTFVAILLLAFVCEWIDSSTGMGYGSILSPFLVIIGFPVLAVVPAVLVSQALGGLFASYYHNNFNNSDFSIKNGKISEDLKTVLWITSLGIIASITAALIGTQISKTLLGTYIGSIVLLMGILILCNFSFVYSKTKMLLVGIVSAFNKGLSGGGFGPLVTGGQIVLGNKGKNAIGITTFAEGPICIVGFLTYWIVNGIHDWKLVLSLSLGAILAAPIGAYTTMKLKNNLKYVIGILLVILGSLSLLKTYGVINIPLSI